MLPRPALTFAFAVLVCAASVHARASQSDNDAAAAPAHVSYVDGAVLLEREGRVENSPLNMPLVSGDRLKTLDGRVEVMFADGSTLLLDARTTLDVQSDDLSRLIDGRVRLNIVGNAARQVGYRIDSPSGSVRIFQAGEYRIALLRRQDDTQLELAVLRGSGEIFTDQGSTPVRAGERAYASAGLMPSYTYAYNSANWDAFDRWSEDRRAARLGVSSQYLPEDVRVYASTFDEYGDWRYQSTYGYVWYPRVAVGWRPYYYGRWMSYPRYGWTWIGADRFAWPTHHYGRWGFASGLWFWIPASHWAPAYVSWAYAPGYVSWCPLGFDNRPVINVNIFNVGPSYYSSARAWTAVSYTSFGRDYYVPQRAVNWDRWDRRTTFRAGAAAPGYRDVAVPRNSTPIQGAGTRSARGDAGVRDYRADSAARPSVDRAPDRGPSRVQPNQDVAVPRAGSAPRYVNRGDEIIRSQTERPSAPVRADETGRSRIDRPSAPDRAVEMPSARERNSSERERSPSERERYGIQRTAPDGAARRIDTPSREIGPAPASPAPNPGYERARPRGYDAPVYQPRPAEQPAESPAYRTRTYDPGPMPRRGGYEPRPPAPAPNPERQAPPPQRAAPSPEAAPPPARAGGSGERAVPRSGGNTSAPVRRGRGGSL